MGVEIHIYVDSKFGHKANEVIFTEKCYSNTVEVGKVLYEKVIK